MKWIDTILCLFLVIAVPDSADGEPDQNLPAWLWWDIGIAAGMLVLTTVALKTKVPRRIAEIITANSNEFDGQ